MTVGILPPEYLPGLELAAVASSVDVLVLADTFQYVRQSRQNRARLRTPTGAQWITVPLQRGPFGRSIASIGIDPRSDWQRKHPKALRFNYGNAAFYSHYVEGIVEHLTRRTERLASVTIATTRWLLDALRMDAEVALASDLPGAPTTADAFREVFGGVSIVVPAGTHKGLRPGDCTVRVSATPYRQAFEGFVPGLSALDLLMNHGPESRSLLASRTQTVPA